MQNAAQFGHADRASDDDRADQLDLLLAELMTTACLGEQVQDVMGEVGHRLGQPCALGGGRGWFGCHGVVRLRLSKGLVPAHSLRPQTVHGRNRTCYGSWQ
jgi:hypothetical protein